MRVTVNWLADVTGKHPATIKKRISNLIPDNRRKYDSIVALEAIYCGAAPGENGFISTPEAVRQLTIAKREQIELANAKFRGEFYPVEWVHFTMKHAMTIVTQTLKANCNRLLTFETVNDILRQFREAFAQLREEGDALEREYEREKKEKEKRAQAFNGSGERPGAEKSNRRGDDQSVSADQIAAA
jgi:hypothetical protein